MYCGSHGKTKCWEEKEWENTHTRANNNNMSFFLSHTHTDTHTHSLRHRSINDDGLEDKSKAVGSFISYSAAV